MDSILQKAKKPNLLFTFFILSFISLYNSISQLQLIKISENSSIIFNSLKSMNILFAIIISILPVSIIGLIPKNLNDLKKCFRYIKSAIWLQVMISLVCATVFIVFSDKIINILSIPSEIKSSCLLYLRINSFTLPLEAIGLIIIISLLSLNKIKNFSIITVSFLILKITLNFIFVNNDILSLDLEVLGYALAKLACSLIIAVFSVIMFLIVAKKQYALKIKIFKKDFRNILNFSTWYCLGSIIKDFMILIILSFLISSISKQNEELVIFNVIYDVYKNFLFAPIISLLIIKQITIGRLFSISNISKIELKLRNSALLSSLYIIIASAIFAIFAPNILNIFNNSIDWTNNISTVNITLICSTIIFIFYSTASLYRTYFIMSSNTKLFFYSSIISAVLVYLIPLILVVQKIINPTFEEGLYIITIQSLIDFLITLVIVKKNTLKLLIKEIDDMFAATPKRVNNPI